MMVDYNAQAQGNYNAQLGQLTGVTDQYTQRLRALQAQQQAADAAAAAQAARQSGANQVAYQAATSGGQGDLAANGGPSPFAGLLAQQQAANTSALGGQGAAEAAYQQQVAAANQQGWNARAATAGDIQGAGVQNLYGQLVDQKAQIADAASGGSGGGGGGGRRGGGGGGGYGGSTGSQTEALAAWQVAHPFDYKTLALTASQGNRKGLKTISKIIGKAQPDQAQRLTRTALDRWDANHAKGVQNGVSRKNLKKVLKAFQKSTYGYERQQYTNAGNAYKYGG